MAIASFHNVPVIESSFLRESQPSSSSGDRGQNRRISTRASSLLRMWRELEDECVVNRSQERGRSSSRSRSRSHHDRTNATRNFQEVGGDLENSAASENESVNNSENHIEPLYEQEDHQSVSSEQSQDLSEVERERVRQIFREWMSSGRSVQPPSVPRLNRNSRGQWLGETERERVRVVREWIQMTSEQREASPANGEEQVAEIGSQIERVRDGEVLHNYGRHAQNGRRVIRRLCGRQALLDLLAKKGQERLQELHHLGEIRPVSNFAHRNRIQSLLRLRCFQNSRSTELRRNSSTAESELGLLRQRQTVSGLREGFLSRLDNNALILAIESSDGSLGNNAEGFENDLTQVNSTLEVLSPSEGSTYPNGDADVDSRTDLNQASGYSAGEASLQESVAQTEATLHPGDVGSSANLNHGTGYFDIETTLQESVAQGEAGLQYGDAVPSANLNLVESGHSGAETSFRELIAQVEARLQLATGSEADNRHKIDTIEHSNGLGDHQNLLLNSAEPSGTVNGDVDNFEESHGAPHHECDVNGEETNVHGQLDNVEVTISRDLNGPESEETITRVEDFPELLAEHEEREQENGVLSNQRGDDDLVQLNGEHSRGDGEDSSHNALVDNGREQTDDQDNWNEDGSQENTRDWLTMPSAGATSSGRVDSYYLSDDDNVYNIELRELLNRRRVSRLLHSGFRESLDQLIQSYVDRQTHAHDVWEVREASPPPFVAREPEHLGPDHDEDPFGPEPAPMMGSQGYWGHSLHHSNWSRHEMHQRPGTDWEVINDLRIDMARLQQRLTNMQRILEACMDMQLELQRSVRQEVSAALNRADNPLELPKNILHKDSFQWDCVRKGICCMCSESNIDSLLYRCGHMCTCTKCANTLVEGDGKCPMCQAPVIEVIRAYFIQD